MTKRNKPTRAELIEAGAALQHGLDSFGPLRNKLYCEARGFFLEEDEDIDVLPWGAWEDIRSVAAQLAAEKAGLA